MGPTLSFQDAQRAVKDLPADSSVHLSDTNPSIFLGKLIARPPIRKGLAKSGGYFRE